MGQSLFVSNVQCCSFASSSHTTRYTKSMEAATNSALLPYRLIQQLPVVSPLLWLVERFGLRYTRECNIRGKSAKRANSLKCEPALHLQPPSTELTASTPSRLTADTRWMAAAARPFEIISPSTLSQPYQHTYIDTRAIALPRRCTPAHPAHVIHTISTQQTHHCIAHLPRYAMRLPVSLVDHAPLRCITSTQPLRLAFT